MSTEIESRVSCLGGPEVPYLLLPNRENKSKVCRCSGTYIAGKRLVAKIRVSRDRRIEVRKGRCIARGSSRPRGKRPIDRVG